MTCTHKRVDFRGSLQYFGSQALACGPQRHGAVLYRVTLARVSAKTVNSGCSLLKLTGRASPSERVDRSIRNRKSTSLRVQIMTLLTTEPRLHGLHFRVFHIRVSRIGHAFTFMFWHRDVCYLLEKRDFYIDATACLT